jgi:hypothetical protein
MTCPYHDTGDGAEGDGLPSTSILGSDPEENTGVDRRAFMKSALTIGGTNALAAVTGMFGMPEPATAAEDSIGIAERWNRQHAWNRFQQTARGTAVPPPHHVLLLTHYQHGGAPKPSHREEMETAFQDLEAQFGWNHSGLLFTVGYSPEYFDRFDESLPTGLDPDTPDVPEAVEPILAGSLRRTEDTIARTELDREDITAEPYDVCIHLASDHVQHLLTAEELLWGESVAIDGTVVELDGSLDGLFDRPVCYPKRRTGFAGRENIVENLEEDVEFEDFDPSEELPDADLSMGLSALYDNSTPRETNITLLEDGMFFPVPKPPGVFAQGSVQHVSKLDVDLERWYEDNPTPQERMDRLFSPDHDVETAGEVAENLGASNSPVDGPPMRKVGREDVSKRTPDHAEEEGVVGHSQKVARGRVDYEDQRVFDLPEGDHAGIRPENLPDDHPESRDEPPRGHDEPQQKKTPLLRRDFDTTDQATPGVHFVALMRFNVYMEYQRLLMNDIDTDIIPPLVAGTDEGNLSDFVDTGDLDLPPLVDQLPDLVTDDSQQFDGEIDPDDSGILNYLTTQRRGNFLVPPLTLRSLPHPRGAELKISASKRGDTWRVTVYGQAEELDPETVRFGHYRDVNRGAGATPTKIDSSWWGTSTTYEFDHEETGIEESDDELRLFGKYEEDGKPARGTYHRLL